MEQITKNPINKPQPATICIITALVIVYISLQMKVEYREYWKYALIPYEIEIRNFWKLFTSPFVHSSIPHLILNIVFIWQRFSHIEKRAGMAFLFVHIFLFSALIGLTYSGIIILFSIAGCFSLYYRPIVGMTSVILALNVIESQLSSNPYSSLLGLIHVPTKWLPVAISLTYHVALNNVSTFAHICALTVGYTYWLLVGKGLRRLWGTSDPVALKKNEDTTVPFNLPGTIIATFDIRSPLGVLSDSADNELAN